MNKSNEQNKCFNKMVRKIENKIMNVERRSRQPNLRVKNSGATIINYRYIKDDTLIEQSQKNQLAIQTLTLTVKVILHCLCTQA